MRAGAAAYASLTAAMLIAGSSVVAGKAVAVAFPVFVATGLRFLLASLVLAPLFLVRHRAFPAAGRDDLAIILLQALANVFLLSFFFFHGLRLTSAAASGVITSTTPAMVGLLAFLLLRERPTRNQGAGIALAVLGLLVLNAAGDPGSAVRGPAPLLGNLLILGAVLGEAAFTVLGKVVVARVPPLAITTLASGFGFLLSLPAALHQARGFDFSAVAPGAWAAMAYYGLCVTVLASFLWYKGIAAVPAATAAVFTGIMPVSALALSRALLDEPILGSHLAGAACVLAGIWMSAFRGRASGGFHDTRGRNV